MGRGGRWRSSLRISPSDRALGADPLQAPGKGLQVLRSPQEACDSNLQGISLSRWLGDRPGVAKVWPRYARVEQKQNRALVEESIGDPYPGGGTYSTARQFYTRGDLLPPSQSRSSAIELEVLRQLGLVLRHLNGDPHKLYRDPRQLFPNCKHLLGDPPQLEGDLRGRVPNSLQLRGTPWRLLGGYTTTPVGQWQPLVGESLHDSKPWQLISVTPSPTSGNPWGSISEQAKNLGELLPTRKRAIASQPQSRTAERTYLPGIP